MFALKSFLVRTSREARKYDKTARKFCHLRRLFFRIGLGGFFDCIVLHQILQWHHMVTSAGFPPDCLANVKVNTFFDGLFHAVTYVFVVIGLVLFWRKAHRAHLRWSGKMLAGSLLTGFGLFNVVDVILDLLKLHHVNETVPLDQWFYWDIGFLMLGGAMLFAGWTLLKASRRI